MRIVSLALAGALGLSAAAQAQTPKLEKPRIALSVGGSISQMNKVAYFVALNRKYFEQEGLTSNSTAFASGTAALQNLIGGNADVVEGSFEHTLRMQTKGQHLMCIAVFGRYPANVLVVRKSQADKIKTHRRPERQEDRHLGARLLDAQFRRRPDGARRRATTRRRASSRSAPA